MERAPAASNPEPAPRRTTRDALRRLFAFAGPGAGTAPVFVGAGTTAPVNVTSAKPARADDGASTPPLARYGDAALHVAHTVLTGIVPPAGDRPVGTERHRGGGAGHSPDAAARVRPRVRRAADLGTTGSDPDLPRAPDRRAPSNPAVGPAWPSGSPRRPAANPPQGALRGHPVHPAPRRPPAAAAPPALPSGPAPAPAGQQARSDRRTISPGTD